MSVEWGWQKGFLLFWGLVLKQLAESPPMSLTIGPELKEIAGILWPAFGGAFLWLLRPPTEKKNGEKPGGTI